MQLRIDLSGECWLCIVHSGVVHANIGLNGSDLLPGFFLQTRVSTIYNNNNNNPICKAPECQKTSVALHSVDIH